MFSSRSVALIGVFFAQTAWSATQPQAIDVGGAAFTPTLRVAASYDDNIFSQGSGDTDSWITTVAPTFQLVAEPGSASLALTYSGDYGVYSNGSEDNYLDHTFSADLLLGTGPNKFTLGVSRAMLHDARGEGSSEGIIATSRPEPDEYDSTAFAAGYSYRGSRIGFSVDGSVNDVEYQNNRLETQFRDRSDRGFEGKVFLEIGPRTSAFVGYHTRDIEYDVLPLFGATLDSTESGYFAGLEWQATAQTTGSVQIGRTDKDFDAASRTDSDQTSWSANLTWAPRTYSTVSIGTSRRPGETNGTGEFIDSSSHFLAWNHSWTDQLSTNLGYNWGNSDYSGDPRDDDTSGYTVGLNIDVYRWLSVGASYNSQERDSNDSLFDFERNVFTLSLDASL